MATVNEFKHGELQKAKQIFNAADIKIGLPSMLNDIPAGEYKDAEYTGDIRVSSGVVNRPTKADGTPNPNHGKKWSNVQAGMKLSVEGKTGVIFVSVDFSSLEKMTAGQVYAVVVESQRNNPQYNQARLKNAL